MPGEAQESDRLKSIFLATMSHELRTPLNSIIGFTGIMLQGLAGPLNNEQHKQMTMVKTSARHLLALINDVLDISKLKLDSFSRPMKLTLMPFHYACAQPDSAPGWRETAVPNPETAICPAD